MLPLLVFSPTTLGNHGLKPGLQELAELPGLNHGHCRCWCFHQQPLGNHGLKPGLQGLAGLPGLNHGHCRCWCFHQQPLGI